MLTLIQNSQWPNQLLIYKIVNFYSRWWWSMYPSISNLYMSYTDLPIKCSLSSLSTDYYPFSVLTVVVEMQVALDSLISVAKHCLPFSSISLKPRRKIIPMFGKLKVFSYSVVTCLFIYAFKWTYYSICCQLCHIFVINRTYTTH